MNEISCFWKLGRSDGDGQRKFKALNFRVPKTRNRMNIYLKISAAKEVMAKSIESTIVVLKINFSKPLLV